MSVKEGAAEEEEGSQRDVRLATFAASPVTQGVTSSIDISPGQESFGFDVQRVATQGDAAQSNDGLGKLIEHMD